MIVDDDMEFSDKEEQNDMMSSMRKLDAGTKELTARAFKRNAMPGPLSQTLNPKVKIKLQKSVGDLIKEMDEPSSGASNPSRESYRRSISRLKTLSFSNKIELSLPEKFNRSAVKMQESDICGPCE